MYLRNNTQVLAICIIARRYNCHEPLSSLKSNNNSARGANHCSPIIVIVVFGVIGIYQHTLMTRDSNFKLLYYCNEIMSELAY